jgi:hypothetical protein
MRKNIVTVALSCFIMFLACGQTIPAHASTGFCKASIPVTLRGRVGACEVKESTCPAEHSTPRVAKNGNRCECHCGPKSHRT